MDAASAAAWASIVVTLGIAIVGWRRAGVADRRSVAADARAVDADTRAARALELAESAEARADRLEQQAGERRDISWSYHLNDAGWLRLRNIGADAAHTVEVYVDPADLEASRRVGRAATIAPTEYIDVDISDLVATAHFTADLMKYSGVHEVPTVALQSVRVAWTSELGTPGVLS